MTLMIELTPELEARLEAQAKEHGKRLSDYVQNTLEEMVTPKEVDMKTFLSLPREEQNRRLAIAAESAAHLYEADLARPPLDRELTAFTALDGEPFIEYPDQEAADHVGTTPR